MIETDKEKFAEGMKILFITFGQEFDPARAYGYWTGLVNKLSIEAFENAVRLALEECERLPSPVELKRLGQRALMPAYQELPPMSNEERKRIRESYVGKPPLSKNLEKLSEKPSGK